MSSLISIIETLVNCFACE